METVKSAESIIGNIGFGEAVEVDKKTEKKVLIVGADSYIGESFRTYAKEHYAALNVDVVGTLNSEWKEKSFSGYDIVYHVAGIAHADVGNVNDEIKAKYYAVNTDLAIEVCDKAKNEGVKEFIFMSSMIVYGDSAPFRKHRIIDENTVPKPANFYGDSKLQADIAVREKATDDFKVIVLRPPMIYGRGSKGNYPVLAKLAKKLPVFPNVENERSMLHIDNLCEFLCMVMLVKEINRNSVVLIPQNAQWTRTSEMVKQIAFFGRKRIKLLKVLKPAVIIAGKMPGKIGGMVNKAFGNFVYAHEISVYPGIDYQTTSLAVSILKTEGTDDVICSVINNIDNEKVSIIMPAYNCSDFIVEAVDSIKKQTYTDWELIVVDDCSKDDTLSILNKLAEEDSRIIVLQNEENMGAAASRNKAVDRASGRYLAFLDSDDVWKETKLSRQIAFMKENDYAFTCTSYGKINGKSENLGTTIDALTIDYAGLLKRCPGNSTVIYDSNQLGKYRIPLIKKRNDYVMWLQVIKAAGMLYGLDEELGYHRIGMATSISANKSSLVKYHWIVYRKIEHLSIIKSAWLCFFWIAKAVFKRLNGK